MALLVIDDATVALGESPNGFVLKLTAMTGFPDGLQLLVPFEGDQAIEVHKAIERIMAKYFQKKPIIATDADIRNIHGTPQH